MEKTKIENIAEWIKKLRAPTSSKWQAPKFLKPYHLVTLGLEFKRMEEKEFDLPESIKSYANRMELWEAVGLAAPSQVKKNNTQGRFIPIQSFTNNLFAQLKVNTAIEMLVQNTVHISSRQALTDCLHELVYNFYDHAGASTELPCLLAAQTWEKGDLVQIAIADGGLGIRATLEQNDLLKSRLEIENSCKLASEYGVTSKPLGQHSGFGLALAKDLMREVKGNYILLSGNEVYSFWGSEKCRQQISSWDGTILVMEWELKNQLNSKSVYDSWPKSENYNEDEFF